MPTVERFTEPADVVRITPLQIRFGDSPVTSVLTGPLLDATRELRDDLAACPSSQVTCRAATPMLLAEILIGQLAGTGSTLDRPSAAPRRPPAWSPSRTRFGDGGPGAARPTTAAPTPSRRRRRRCRPVDGAGRAGVVPPPPVAVRTPRRRHRPDRRLRAGLRSVHPFDWPSCSAGVGAVRRHRRRRSPPRPSPSSTGTTNVAGPGPAPAR